MKTYTKDEVLNHPTTQMSRRGRAVIKYLHSNKNSTEDLFLLIDKEYEEGTPRTPNYIKKQKILALKLINLIK